ncbi:MAG TPA: ferrochelatase [Candidatus Limnocylindria bacterium]|nr:ferrochelatase [Candidatus Limnocylindria bacterium]
MRDRLGVLLMTYGSPSSLDDVGRYLAAVRGGRQPSGELVAEFRRRYQLIGGSSPLVEITRAQAAALERELADGTRVEAAMRFSEPSIESAVGALVADGVTSVRGVVMSPQHSELLMGGYRRALAQAAAEAGVDARVAPAWYADESFIGAVARRIGEGLARLPAVDRDRAPVLLTAHSLPRPVAEQDPGYLAQLRATAESVAARAGLGGERWHFCWQSAGHEPGEWMKPDFADLLPQLAADGRRSVLVAPIQFLADHLEVLYDVDIAARAQAEEAGLAFLRIESLNTMPEFIRALAGLVRRVDGSIRGNGKNGPPSPTWSSAGASTDTGSP